MADGITTVVDPLKIQVTWEAAVNRVDGSVWQPIFISCSCGESCLEGAFCRIS